MEAISRGKYPGKARGYIGMKSYMGDPVAGFRGVGLFFLGDLRARSRPVFRSGCQREAERRWPVCGPFQERSPKRNNQTPEAGDWIPRDRQTRGRGRGGIGALPLNDPGKAVEIPPSWVSTGT